MIPGILFKIYLVRIQLDINMYIGLISGIKMADIVLTNQYGYTIGQFVSLSVPVYEGEFAYSFSSG